MTTANTFLLSRDVITSDSQSCCRAFSGDGNRDGFFAYTSGDDARKSESSLLGLVGGGGVLLLHVTEATNSTFPSSTQVVVYLQTGHLVLAVATYFENGNCI